MITTFEEFCKVLADNQHVLSWELGGRWDRRQLRGWTWDGDRVCPVTAVYHCLTGEHLPLDNTWPVPPESNLQVADELMELAVLLADNCESGHGRSMRSVESPHWMQLQAACQVDDGGAWRRE